MNAGLFCAKREGWGLRIVIVIMGNPEIYDSPRLAVRLVQSGEEIKQKLRPLTLLVESLGLYFDSHERNSWDRIFA